MEALKWLFLSISICVTSANGVWDDCVQRFDVLFCQESASLPLNTLDLDINTLIMDDAMEARYVNWLKDRIDLQIIVWGQKHCVDICDGITNYLWQHQCICQVNI